MLHRTISMFSFRTYKWFARHRFVFIVKTKKTKTCFRRIQNISRRQNYFCTIWFFLILTFAICKYQKNSLAIFIFSQGDTVHVGFCIIRNGFLEIIVLYYGYILLGHVVSANTPKRSAKRKCKKSISITYNIHECLEIS